MLARDPPDRAHGDREAEGRSPHLLTPRAGSITQKRTGSAGAPVLVPRAPSTGSAGGHGVREREWRAADGRAQGALDDQGEKVVDRSSGATICP
jgi:hypothetical protein